MKKRVVSLLLALLLVLGLVPGAAAIETGADWDPDVEVDPGMGVTPIGMPEGEGTEDDPLRIENQSSLHGSRRRSQTQSRARRRSVRP